MRLGCVVMACGSGTRFAASGGAGDKLLADVCGAPLIVRTALSVPSDEFETVMPVRSSLVADTVGSTSLPVALVRVGNAAVPRSLSTRMGLAFGSDRWDGCLFLPGDQPLVRASSFLALARALEADPRRAWRLSWHGRGGSPVIFPASCFGRLMTLEGSQGGGQLLRDGFIEAGLVEASSASELWDVDTCDDLERMRSAAVFECRA